VQHAPAPFEDDSTFSEWASARGFALSLSPDAEVALWMDSLLFAVYASPYLARAPSSHRLQRFYEGNHAMMAGVDMLLTREGQGGFVRADWGAVAQPLADITGALFTNLNPELNTADGIVDGKLDATKSTCFLSEPSFAPEFLPRSPVVLGRGFNGCIDGTHLAFVSRSDVQIAGEEDRSRKPNHDWMLGVAFLRRAHDAGISEIVEIAVGRQSRKSRKRGWVARQRRYLKPLNQETLSMERWVWVSRCHEVATKLHATFG
jgi:hypothetical protein